MRKKGHGCTKAKQLLPFFGPPKTKQGGYQERSANSLAEKYETKTAWANKKLGVGKAKDLVELQAKYLKWGSKTLAPHITKIFNIIQQGFPID